MTTPVRQRLAAAARRALSGLADMHRRTPLRVRLVAAVLLLVIVALLGSGLAARATLGSYLIGRLDSQLADAEHGLVDHELSGDAHGGGPTGPAPDGGDRGRLPSNFVVEVTGPSGTVLIGPLNNLVDSTQPLPSLPRPTAAESVASGPRTFSVGAVHGDEQWRVLARPVRLPNGSTGTLLVAQSLADVQSTVDRLTALLAMIGAAAVLIIAAVGYLVVRLSLRPLRAVERAASTIAAGDLSHRVPQADRRTEVGQLSAALNRMLAEIETAFADRAASEQGARSSEERMRRFVADASHELRTPLTTIRGFAELYRQGGAASDADVARFMRRIEDEAKRMGLLVEDLLLLARMDQERPLARNPVDLLLLASDGVNDARAVAPDRPIRLEVGATDPPPVVLGDEARLRQVLANLIGNALTHTPAGTPVTVTVATATGRERGPTVVVSVADDGPGLTSEAAGRVFERFYRADAARNRRDGGSGLGLAIVAALVAGHGGAVSVESAPGAGACFRVELPLADPAAEPSQASSDLPGTSRQVGSNAAALRGTTEG